MDKTKLQHQLKNAHDAFGVGLAGAVLLQSPQAWALLEKIGTARYNTLEVNLQDVVKLLKHGRDCDLVVSELMKLLLRSTVSEAFERVKAYCEATSQMDELRKEPWYLFAKLVRNSARHSLVVKIQGRKDKVLLPVSWKGRVISESMCGNPLPQGFIDADFLWEILKMLKAFVAGTGLK